MCPQSCLHSYVWIHLPGHLIPLGVSPQLLDLHLAQSFRAIAQVLAQALQIATASLSSGIIQSGHEETSNVLSCVESSWVFNAGTPA